MMKPKTQSAINNQQLAILFLTLAWHTFASATTPVVLEFFHTPGCTHCESVRRDVILPARADYGDLLDVHEIDLNNTRQYTRLTFYRNTLARPDQPPSTAAAVLDGALLFELPDLQSPGFATQLATCVAWRMENDPTSALAPEMPAEGLRTITESYKTFTLLGIANAD